MMTPITAVPQSTDRISTHTQRELRELEQAIRISPHDGALHLERAELLFEMGAWRAASEGYQNARRFLRGQKSATALTYFKDGICQYMQGRFLSAEILSSQSIQEMPEAPHAWYIRGKIRLLYLDKKEDGIRDLRESLVLAERSSAQTFIARYLVGEYDEAFHEYETLLSMASEEEHQTGIASLQYQLASLYGMTGNPIQAVQQLRTAFDTGFQQEQWFSWDPSFMPVSESPLFHQFLQSEDLRYYHHGLPAYQPPGSVSHSNSRGTSATFGRGDLEWGTPSLRDQDQNAILSANELAILEIPIHNNSRHEAEFLVTLSIPDSFEADIMIRRTDPFNHISTGKHLVLSWELQATAALPSGQLPVSISLEPVSGWGPSPLEVRFQTQAYEALLLEIPDHHFASEYGGNMEPGVPVLFTFAVQNTGKAIARDVTIRISLPDGVFSTQADEVVLNQLDPGEANVIEFEFFTQRDYPEPWVSLPVFIQAGDRNWTTSDTFRVRMNRPLEVTEQVVIRPIPRKIRPDVIALGSSVDKDLPQTLNEAHKAIAIVIGNRDYSHPDVPVVDYALKDAASMRRYLIESFGFLEENVLFLTNASQADFYGLFGTSEDHQARLFNLVQPGQTDVFIFYSGHGAPDPNTQTGYFLPIDCDPTLVRFNGYPLKTFYQNLSKTPYKSLTVVLDACFSGNSEQGSLIQQASPVHIKAENPILQDPNAWVLSAAASDQIASWNQDEAHGLFTWLVLQAFQGAADSDRNGLLTYEELRRYLSSEVPQQARRLHNRYQTPDIYGLDSRVLLKYE